MKHKIGPLPAGLFVAMWVCSFAEGGQITSTSNWSIVKRLTGPGAINNTAQVGIGGTDLGHMVNHNGRTYFLFGDTFSGDTPSEGGDWRSSAMAYSTDSNPANGIAFDGWLTRPNGTAIELIASTSPSVITEIPTGGISVNNHVYAWYMAVDHWGPPGVWTNNHAGLARWREGESRFTRVNNFAFPANSNFGMVAASQRSPAEGVQDDYVYVWGTPAGRRGGVKLARVSPNQIENRSAYRYFDGTVNGQPRWISDEFAADYVVPAWVSEMSVMYNEAVGAWTMLYGDEQTGNFEIRQSPTPWGAWSEPVTVISSLATQGWYAPYMNPLYVEDGGEDIYFTLSNWGAYDVYLVKASLNIKSDLELIRDNFLETVPALTKGDLSGDGFVDFADFRIWRDAAGSGAIASDFGLVVPEPETALIATMLAFVFCVSTKRRSVRTEAECSAEHDN